MRVDEVEFRGGERGLLPLDEEPDLHHRLHPLLSREVATHVGAEGRERAMRDDVADL